MMSLEYIFYKNIIVIIIIKKNNKNNNNKNINYKKIPTDDNNLAYLAEKN